MDWCRDPFQRGLRMMPQGPHHPRSLQWELRQRWGPVELIMLLSSFHPNCGICCSTSQAYALKPTQRPTDLLGLGDEKIFHFILVPHPCVEMA